MADTRSDWRPNWRTIREEQERGQTKKINPKALAGLSLEEMLKDLEEEKEFEW